MRGRRPTPTVLRVLKGNPGKRAYNPDEPLPGALPLTTPEELVDPAAQAEWVRTIVPAIERGQVTGGDRAMAILHCQYWATWRSQLEEAAKHAHVVAVGANKYPIQNPAQVAANKSALLLMRCDAELGLSPSSRSRVRTSGGYVRSKVEEFRRAKGGR